MISLGELMAKTVNDDRMPRGCRLIEFPVSSDQRGSLSFAESMRHIPFKIERVFWIYGIPEDKTRGNRSHNEAAEVIIPVAGSFEIYVSDGSREITLTMDSPERGILIPPGIWCELRGFSKDTVCLVIASHRYDESGYTNSFEQYRSDQMSVVRYDSDKKDIWNRFVADSKNGTFLMDRDYMDYHSDRFQDCSLMFYKHGNLTAILPANYCADSNTVYSHQGLTYGGLLLSKKISAVETLEVFSCAIDWMQTMLGSHRWIYKPVPYIYCSLPSEEDLYAVFRTGGRLSSRLVASVVDSSNRLPWRKLRVRGINKAVKAGISIDRVCTDSDWDIFWGILSDVLLERHNNQPVHSLDEIKLLAGRFPDNISLYVARKDGRIVAGTVIYETAQVAHTQYIASSPEGRSNGALDMLFDELTGRIYADKPYFDFGTSNGQDGNYLNEGLIFQKEGFGARSVVYDSYEIIF